jgi:hypothetical protein
MESDSNCVCSASNYDKVASDSEVLAVTTESMASLWHQTCQQRRVAALWHHSVSTVEWPPCGTSLSGEALLCYRAAVLSEYYRASDKLFNGQDLKDLGAQLTGPVPGSPTCFMLISDPHTLAR